LLTGLPSRAPFSATLELPADLGITIRHDFHAALEVAGKDIRCLIRITRNCRFSDHAMLSAHAG
jgi:hypothetical protein